MDVLDDRAIRVSALAVGTAEGGPVRHADGSIYLQETRTVISRMQVRNLKTLAANTGGIVRSFSATNQDVNAIIGLTKVPIAAYKDKRQQDLDQKVNAGFWLLIPLLCFAALAYRKGITLFTLPILIILQYSPLPAYAERPEKASKDTISMYFDNSDQRGYRYFEAGDYETAALSFSDPVWKAIALYRSGRFHAAVSVLEPLSDKSTRYNLANAYVRIGDIDRAITSYKEALEFNPQHEAAAHNLNLLLDVLGRSSEKVSINPKSEQQLRQEQKKQAAPRSTRSKDDKTRGKNRELASEQEGNKQDQSNRNQSQKNQSSDQSKTKQNDKGKKNNDTNRTQAKRPAPKAGGSQSGAISDPVIKKLEQIPDQPERLLRAQMLLQSQKRDLPEVTENTW
ncbi:hypothetical protein A8L45_05690 [Veronia pacifica]|uniref:Uncharacterized protein n=1 Tax=Veronia pacifica TaxID=1080227 RepID=A0A1C3EMI3_9GAMM|nr:hypothetical protein A8L45_05690 [Veronia pacifica]